MGTGSYIATILYYTTDHRYAVALLHHVMVHAPFIGHGPEYVIQCSIIGPSATTTFRLEELLSQTACDTNYVPGSYSEI